MADITRRTAKRIAAHLGAGETVEAALLCEPRGTYGAGMVALALLPRTMARHIDRRAEARQHAEGGIAAAFPTETVVIAITDARVLVLPSNGLRFGSPALVLDHDQMALGETRSRGLGRRQRLVFADGSAVEVDLQRGQPVGRVEELLGRVG